MWDELSPLAHELYLAHSRCLKLAGPASVEIDVALGASGSEALRIAWSYWDGDLWREVAPPEPGDDTTIGLTRAGSITVRTACAAAEPVAVQEFESYWLRGRLVDPLPPGALTTLPAIDRLRLRTVLERAMDAKGVGGLLPDAAFAGAQAIDVTKPFQPLGPAPGSDAAFYVACEEAFARPEAAVSIWLDRPKTAQELADEEADEYRDGRHRGNGDHPPSRDRGRRGIDACGEGGALARRSAARGVDPAAGEDRRRRCRHRRADRHVGLGRARGRGSCSGHGHRRSDRRCGLRSGRRPRHPGDTGGTAQSAR